MMSAAVSARRVLLLAAGFTIWALAFVALYSALSVGCRFGWDQVELSAGLSLQRGLLVLLFAAHLAAGIALAWWTGRRRAGARARTPRPAAFLDEVSFGAAAAAAASTAFTFFAVFGASSCH